MRLGKQKRRSEEEERIIPVLLARAAGERPPHTAVPRAMPRQEGRIRANEDPLQTFHPRHRRRNADCAVGGGGEGDVAAAATTDLRRLSVARGALVASETRRMTTKKNASRLHRYHCCLDRRRHRYRHRQCHHRGRVNGAPDALRHRTAAG